MTGGIRKVWTGCGGFCRTFVAQHSPPGLMVETLTASGLAGVPHIFHGNLLVERPRTRATRSSLSGPNAASDGPILRRRPLRDTTTSNSTVADIASKNTQKSTPRQSITGLSNPGSPDICCPVFAQI